MGEESLKFHEMGLNDIILKGIAKLGWSEPTLVQEKGIPLALEGKDILARARTGSGKTGAFAIPIINYILEKKPFYSKQVTKALIMAPTKELCNQIMMSIMKLAKYCSDMVQCINISNETDPQALKTLLRDGPDIVIGTPARVKKQIEDGNLLLRNEKDEKLSVEFLVIDEADLIFSFGHKEDINFILGCLPDIYQAFLTSATLTEDTLDLKKLVLHNPVTLELKEPLLPTTKQLSQYHIKCEEEDKFVIIYALLKLNLISGKSIIFMNSVDRCFKMKLYLEQFGIKSCILNSEMPMSTRCQIVCQFNEDLYNIIIASDDHTVDEQNQVTKPVKGKRKIDGEYSVSRGIDFQFISNIINFDFPRDVNSYIHRVGRTARGNNKGAALSFISIKELPIFEEVDATLAQQEGYSLKEKQEILKPFFFKTEKIEGFRYRARDALRAVTRIAIREARLKEIKRELLNSQKLKTYFQDNPRDLQVLRHDKTLHTVKIQSHLKHVPEYIVPDALKKIVPQSKKKPLKLKPRISKKQATRMERKFKKREADPLDSLSYKKKKTN